MDRTFEIRPAVTDADVTEVGRLMRSYAASLDVDLGYQDFEAELAGLPGTYAPPKGALLLARAIDGEAIGCIAVRALPTAGDCEMKRLYVAPAGRGKGLGRRLAEAAIEEALRLGYRVMKLDTLPSMHAAQALYRELGFEPCAAYYETPVAGTAFLRLEL